MIAAKLATSEKQRSATIATPGVTGGVANSRSSRALLLCAGLSTLLVVASVVYRNALDIGFLLDDFALVDKIHRAFNHDPGDLIYCLLGSWGGPDGVPASYRPAAVLLSCFDYRIWGVRAFGYHLTNLTLLSACAAVLGLLVYRTAIAPSRGRLTAAVSAALLFLLYPIHPEAVAWIVGRVDVLCGLFYLSAIYSYVCFRTNGCTGWLLMSLSCTLISLCAKEMAITIPAVVLAAEQLLAGPLAFKKLAPTVRYASFAAFVALAGSFLGVRAILIGDFVGGYQSATPIAEQLLNLLSSSCIAKLLIGISEEGQVPEQLFPVIVSSLALIAAVSATKVLQSRSHVRVLLFYLLWTCLSILPTFQVWNIAPNLCGSRLFFIGSAPLCACLVLSVFNAAVVPISFERNSRRQSLLSVIQWIGIASLITLSVSWWIALEHNLASWQEAGRLMKHIKAQMRACARRTRPDNAILICDLPRDFQGAGMIATPSYFDLMMSRPFSEQDYASKFLHLSSRFDSAYIHSGLLASVRDDALIEETLRWNNTTRRFESLEPPCGADKFVLTKDKAASANNQFGLANVAAAKRLASPNAPAGSVSFEVTPDSITVKALPGNVIAHAGKRHTVWLPIEPLSPLEVGYFAVELEGVDQNGRKILCDSTSVSSFGVTHLVWKTLSQMECDKLPARFYRNQLFIAPWKDRCWALKDTIYRLGIELTCGVDIRSLSLRLVPMNRLVPQLELSEHARPLRLSGKHALRVSSSSKMTDIKKVASIYFDCSSIPGAKAAAVFICRPNFTTPDYLATDPPDERMVAWKTELPTARGSLEIPERFRDGKSRQVAVLALDSERKPIGFLSEPALAKVVSDKTNLPPLLRLLPGE